MSSIPSIPNREIFDYFDDLGCSPGRINGSFAFSIMSELLVVTIFIFSILYLLNILPRSIYGPSLTVSALILLLFSIIQFSTLGENCIRIGKVQAFGRLELAFITAVKNILTFFLVLLVIIYNVVVAKGDFLLRDSVPAAKQDPALANPSTATPYMPPAPGIGPQHTILSPMQPAIAQPPMPAQQPVIPVQQPPMVPVQPAVAAPMTQQTQQ